MKLEFSAGGIVIRKSANSVYFALILSSDNTWTFPKGHIENKEKPEAAALREVEEEAGLKNLKILSPLEKIDYWFKKDSVLIHKFVYFYLMEADENNDKLVHQESEINDARWFTLEESFQNLKYKEDFTNLQHACSHLKIAFPAK